MVTKTSKAALIEAICADSDDIDGWGFNRIGSVVATAIEMFGDGRTAGEYVKCLMEDGLIEVYAESDEVWISPEVFEKYCGLY